MEPNVNVARSNLRNDVACPLTIYVPCDFSDELMSHVTLQFDVSNMWVMVILLVG